jgi:drug/metabolite transporter (DMT)-like permease
MFSGLDPAFSFEPTWPSHGYLLALALGSQVAGWLMITYALPRLAALETSLLMLMQPMISLFVAALLLGERISWLQSVGIVLVIGGVAYVSLKGATTPVQGEQAWMTDSSPEISRSGA